MSSFHTPCPVKGIAEEDLTPGIIDQAWNTVKSKVRDVTGVGEKAPAQPQDKKLGFIVVYAPGVGAGEEKYEGGGGGGAAPCDIQVGSAMTLQEVYEKVATHYGIAVDSFAICHRSTNAVVTMEDLRSSSAMVAYVDTRRTIRDAGELTIPLPRGPKPHPISKNADSIFLPNMLVAHLKLMRKYGPVFSIVLPGPHEGDAVFVADPDMIEQIVTQPELWQKLSMKHNKIIRSWVGDGIFTSDDDEPIWGIAHRILLPAFSNQGMKNYFLDVMECASLLFNEWDKVVPLSQPIDVTHWAERFTFDVIGRVAFSQDFKAIVEGKHPYLSRVEKSAAVMEKVKGYSFMMKMVMGKRMVKMFQEPNQGNVAFVDEIVAHRKAEISRGERLDAKDMLTLMLTAKDPKTGIGLSDQNIRNQILTFLFAGHDSTSTAITSLMLFIAQHGNVERKIVEEVRRVVGDEPLTYEKLGKLEYCTQVINESLRMFPPAQAIRKQAVKDTQLGPYFVKKGTHAIVSLWAVAHNPEAWPDPWKFDPDRWSPENSQGRNAYASMPFSFGARGCLGRQLSIMEQRVFLVHVVQRYHIRLHSRSQPTITAPIFLKPHNVFVSLETKEDAPDLPPITNANLSSSSTTTTTSQGATAEKPRSLAASLPAEANLLVLYGSNMGTCEAFAKEMANQGTSLGLPSVQLPLNDILTDKDDRIKKASAVLIITSTYNGTPPDNAVDFIRFLEKDKPGTSALFGGVRFAVFGCGNTQWQRTYQRIPMLIDQALAEAGGVRLTGFVGGDADSSMEEALEEWKKDLWQQLLHILGVDAKEIGGGGSITGFVPLYTVTPSKEPQAPQAKLERVASDFAMRNGLVQARIVMNRELQDVSSSGRSTRHVEIELPKHLDYTAGDHLAVYGGNSEEVVKKAADLVGMGLDDVVTVDLSAPERAATNIVPLKVPLMVRLILTWCVELQLPATRNQVSYLVEMAGCPPEKKSLQSLVDGYDTEVLKAKRTILEILDSHRSIKIDLAGLLSMLPALKPRYYSISSSPKDTPGKVSVTVGVVKGPSPTGRLHLGVASNFLAGRQPGDPLRVFVKDTKSTFRLPDDPNTPIILVGPGTGVAPLRGFLLDRQAIRGAKGDAVLFFGCRTDADYIYKEEMEAFVANGVLKDLHVAFSRKSNQEKVYVQNLIEANGPSLAAMLDAGGHIYVCGDAKYMAPDVREAFAKILSTAHGSNVVEGRREVEQLIAGKRYHEDVWAT